MRSDKIDVMNQGCTSRSESGGRFEGQIIMRSPRPAGTRERGRLAHAGFAVAFLMLGACVPDHPEIPAQQMPKADKAVTPKVAVDIAERERAAGNPAAAIPFFRRALAMDPRQPKIQQEMGETMLDAGMPNDAVTTFRALLATTPNDPAAQIGFGMALVQTGQAASAVGPLRKGLAAMPNPRGYRALGVAENLLGDNLAAEADYNRGLALAPGDQGLQTNLGLSMALSGNFSGAISVLRAAAAAPDATAKTRQNLALALGLAGKSDDAAQIARIDLDEASVQSNLAYYAQLRSLSPKERTQALLRPGKQGQQ
jgi:Flp pilus assembly protein TadD